MSKYVIKADPNVSDDVFVALGLTKLDRARLEELSERCIFGAKTRNDGYYRLSSIIHKMSQECKSPEDLAITCFVVGMALHRLNQ
jgi:hypothetical protein